MLRIGLINISKMSTNGVVTTFTVHAPNQAFMVSAKKNLFWKNMMTSDEKRIVYKNVKREKILGKQK